MRIYLGLIAIQSVSLVTYSKALRPNACVTFMTTKMMVVVVMMMIMMMIRTMVMIKGNGGVDLAYYGDRKYPPGTYVAN